MFQPTSGPGEYYVYYLPNIGSGRSNYPKVVYPAPEDTAQPQWLASHRLSPGAIATASWQALPRADVVEFQAIDELNSFYPMEVIATGAETRALLAVAIRSRPTCCSPRTAASPSR